jgi:hypothetical protein
MSTYEPQPAFVVGQQVHYQGSKAADYPENCRFTILGFEQVAHPQVNNAMVSYADGEPPQYRYLVAVYEGDENTAVMRGVREGSIVELYTVCRMCNFGGHVCPGCGEPIAHPAGCCTKCGAR